jgi:hypothetical protein
LRFAPDQGGDQGNQGGLGARTPLDGSVSIVAVDAAGNKRTVKRQVRITK